jgi:hypothetical protein
MLEDVLLTLLPVKLRRLPTNSSNNSSNKIIPSLLTLPMTLLSCHQPPEWHLSSNPATISPRSRNPMLPTQTHQAFSNKRRPTKRRQCQVPDLLRPNTPLSTRLLQLLLAAPSTRHTSLHRLGRLRRTQHPSTDKQRGCLWIAARRSPEYYVILPLLGIAP